MNDKNIKIFDTTLRDGLQAPGNSISLNQKIRIAHALTDLGVDIIEAGFPICKKDATSEIAKEIKDTQICALARCRTEDIDAVRTALESAKKPTIHLFYPTSRLHLKVKFGQTEKQALETIKKHLEYARNYFDNIIFSAEDATRSNLNYLIQVFETAYSYGANTLNIADTVGYAQPTEISDLVKYIKKKLPKAKLSIHCHNDLGLGVANTLAAIQAGVNQIQTTINGIGERSGNAALEEVITALIVRKDFYKRITNVDPKQLYKISRLVYNALERKPGFEKAVVGVNSFSHKSGIHVKAIAREPLTYELLDPSTVGRERRVVQ